MWAQLMRMQMKPGKQEQMNQVFARLRDAEQPGSGLVRTMAFQDQKDPGGVFVLVVFESEQAARAREADPARAEMMTEVQSLMADVFVGPPEFFDLDVLHDVTP
jgi:quinol monooxygenase YgiN